MSTWETLTFEREDAIGTLTLNRPDRRNAINFKMREELRGFWHERQEDRETRVLIMTGAGAGFCSGVDLKESTALMGQPMSPEKAYTLQSEYSETILLMRRVPQPIIAAIRGAAVGAGFSFTLACDIRLASPSARFQATYINLGLGGADMSSSYFFPRQVGAGNAARYLYSGDFFGAEEALRMGLVSAIVPEEKLLEETKKLATVLAGKSPLGLRLTKEALNQNLGPVGLEAAINLEDRNQALLIANLAQTIKR
jgi:enoyl-CoA hydratase